MINWILHACAARARTAALMLCVSDVFLSFYAPLMMLWYVVVGAVLRFRYPFHSLIDRSGVLGW